MRDPGQKSILNCNAWGYIVKITAIIDEENRVAEKDETNNTLTRSLAP